MSTMHIYMRICMCMFVVFLVPTECMVMRHSSTKGCVAHLSSGLINLRNLARDDGTPRFTTHYMGMNFSFNPCLPFGNDVTIHTQKPLLDVHVSTSSSKSSHIVLGTLKSASFKNPNGVFCHSKSPLTTSQKCPISEILRPTHGNVRGEAVYIDDDAAPSGLLETRSGDYNTTDDEVSATDDDTSGDDPVMSDSSLLDNEDQGITQYPRNITAVLRLGNKGECDKYKAMVLLQCVPELRSLDEASFYMIHTDCPDKLHFVLSHRCCCEGLCDSLPPSTTGDATTRVAPVLFRDNLSTDHNIHPDPDKTLPVQVRISDNDTLLDVGSPVLVEATPKYMWLILVVNVGVLATAIIIAGTCCRKSGSSTVLAAHGPYNYLPDLSSIRQKALHSSRLTMAESMESFGHHQVPPKTAEYLDYSSARVKSSQVPQLTNCVILSGDIDIGKRLGGGLFGDTYIAAWKDRTLAAKRITVGVHQSQLTEEHYTWLVDQITYLSKQRHKHIAAVIGVVKDTRQPFVLTEYIEGDSLKDILTKDPDAFNWQHKLKICIQAAEGLAYLHSSRTPVLHRDLRCANIIIDKYDRAKIVDFGMTKLVQKLRQACNGRKGCYCKKELSALPASVRWTAPEVLEHPKADENSDIISAACDVYSYAMVMWEVASHCDPFEDVPDENEVMELILSGVRPRVDILIGTISNFRELMILCWDHNPENRPTSKQMVYQLKNCLQIMSKMSTKQRSRVNSSTYYLKSALNVPAD